MPNYPVSNLVCVLAVPFPEPLGPIINRRSEQVVAGLDNLLFSARVLA